jgi:hypothetical protein
MVSKKTNPENTTTKTSHYITHFPLFTSIPLQIVHISFKNKLHQENGKKLFYLRFLWKGPTFTEKPFS